MGNVLSSCCGGVLCIFEHVHGTDCWAGRQKDGLYEPALADSEREAVAELLQYLENVCLYTQCGYI